MSLIDAGKYNTLAAALAAARTGDCVVLGNKTYTHAGLLTWPASVGWNSNQATINLTGADGQLYVPDAGSGAGTYFGGFLLVNGNNTATPGNPSAPTNYAVAGKGGIVQFGSKDAGAGAKAVIDHIQVRSPGPGAVCFLFANMQNWEAVGLRVTDGSTAGAAVGCLIDYGTKNSDLGPSWFSGCDHAIWATTSAGTQQTSKVNIDGGLHELGANVIIEDVSEFTMLAAQWNLGANTQGIVVRAGGLRSGSAHGPTKVVIADCGFQGNPSTATFLTVDANAGAPTIMLRELTVSGAICYQVEAPNTLIIEYPSWINTATYFASAAGVSQSQVIVKIATTSDLAGAGNYGDGSDGPVGTVTTLGAGTTTLTRDMYYDSLVIPSGAILESDGYVVYCKTKYDLQSGGTHRCNGAAGATDAASGTAGAGSTSHTLTGRKAGGAGGTTAGAAGTASGNSLSGAAGAGGVGGVGGANAGGAAGATTAATGDIRSLPFAAMVATWNATGGLVPLAGGAGGGGGGGDGTLPGGGGGAGGGVIAVIAKEIVIAGVMQARGGAGGAANASGGSGSRGGGGGGSGGLIVLIYSRKTITATPSVTGGNGGVKNGTGGVGGVTGSAGVVRELVNA